MEEKLNRGDLYYAVLEDDNYIGSEQTGIRPVLILQNDIGNKFSPTTIIAPITSKVKTKAKLPTHVFIKGYKKRLERDSIILLEQLRVIDKKRLHYYIGALDKGEMKLVDK
ncbi:MAG: type II toxin-antitoxin system PemK/MazF family toxin, partial [Clostridia bacterium]|nr:type II toxin-antitoxin system PemK/MazF family toxin [Clostridia bacterium]